MSHRCEEQFKQLTKFSKPILNSLKSKSSSPPIFASQFLAVLPQFLSISLRRWRPTRACFR